MEPVNNTADRGPYMMTRLGYHFYPLDPKKEDFRVFEISESLSKTCRYNGHSPYFYSVAEHCVHLANYFLRKYEIENARWAWAHDGAEAYIGDMIRPIKWLFPDFRNIEAKIEDVYFHEFLGLKGDCPKTVMEADTLICNDERYSLWLNEKVDGEYVVQKWGLDKLPKLGDKLPKLGIDIGMWQPAHAGLEFRKMYNKLFPELVDNGRK